MSERIIAPLSPAELEDLSELEERCFPTDPWPRCLLASALEGYGNLALGLYCPELCGCALGRIVADEAELHSIAVHPASRRKGHARALLEAFLEQCRDAGVRHVWLEVRASNHPAIALYGGRGFKASGRRPGYYDDGEDALIYLLDLA